MQHSVVSSPSSRKIFSACLLSYLLIMTPFMQVVAATRQRTVVRSEKSAPSETAKATASTLSVNAPLPQPAPEPLFAPSITATKSDNLAAATTVAPGGTIDYTVNINNGGVSPADDATGVVFSDTIDPHTTLVPGSPVAAASDKYNTIGNVQISVPDGATDLLGNDFDPDTGNNAGMTATAETKSSTACTGGCTNNVTINANGSFTYDPPAGFTGTDTFTYTANSGTNTVTSTVTITVANKIWFINNNAGACTSNCDGRLSHPFQSILAFTTANQGGPGQPGDNDWIFIFESSDAYVGPAVLRAGQKFIGQDATAGLISLTGFTQPSGTDPIPVMASGNGTIVNITAVNANGITLLTNNLLRGFTVSNVGTGTKISGSNFGTLTVGNNVSPDVTLSGTGQALGLSTGTFAATSAFVSVASTSSATQGVNLAGIAGTVSFGSTTISGSSTQGVLIGTTTAAINLGNTSVTGGSDGVSFQNNSAGTRTIGTLNVSGSTGNAFLHGAGGGNVTVAGAATLSSANSAVAVSSPGATNVINFQGATSATSTGAGNTGVNWSGTAGATINFNSLSIQRNNGTALNATVGGTINITNGTGSINNTTPAGAAIIANSVTLNANFASINSTGGTSGVGLTNVTGTSNLGGGSLTGTALGPTFLVAGGTTTVTYSGGITQGNNAAMVSIGSAHSAGSITFQTGTLSATNGTGLQFDNADGDYNFNGPTTLAGGDAGIDILNGSSGDFSFASGTSITSPTGPAFNVGSVPGNPIVTYSGNITQNNNARVVNIDGTTSNTITFNTGTLTGGASSTGININNANGNVTFSNGFTLGTSGARMTNQAVTITNGTTGIYSLGAISVFTTGAAAQGIAATDVNGTINSSSGEVNASGARAINIDGPAGLTTLGMTLTAVAANGGANGILLRETNGNFTVNGTVSGTDRCGGLVTVNAVGTPATVSPAVTAECTGGTIQATTAAGIVIDNATSISLNRMRILNPATDGIDINTINGFTLNKSLITDNAGVGGDKGIDINFASGTSVNGAINITNSFIGPTPHDNLGATISSGTSTWNVTGTVFDDSQLNSGFNWEIRGSAVVSSFTMDGCVLRNQFADGMQMQPNATATATITVANIQNNTFQSNNLGLDLNHDGTAAVTYRVINNTFRTHESHAINLFSSAVQAPTTGGTFNSRFEGNVIGNAGINDSGSRLGNGLRVNINGGTDATTSIINNTIRQTPNGRGIEIISRNGTGGLDATVTGNNVDVNFRVTPENGGADLAAIFMQSNCVGACNTLRSDVRNNTVPAVAAGADLLLGQLILVRTSGAPNPAGTSTLNLVDTTAPISGTCASELAGTNTGSTAASATCVLIGGPISTVAMLQPKLRVDRGYELAKLDAPRANDGSTLLAFASAKNDVASMAMNNVTPVAEFMTRLANTALQAPSVASVALANHERVSAASAALKRAVTNAINPSATAYSATATSTNMPKVKTEKAQVRSHHAKISRAVTPKASVAMTPVMAGETVTANIGTLPAGGSVTITFQVTVNNPPNLTLLGPPRVENQGTVTANGGISVLTDDPDFGGGADKTRTLIDLFDTTTTLASDLNPSDFGDLVTFTATINETPVQGGADPTGTVDFIDTSNGNAVICDNVTVTGGQAQCQTSTLTPGTHNIRADYSGDGNFDPSQSDIVAQVVNACTQDPIVTSTADAGAGSLREALGNVCAGDTITFNIAGAGPHTIALTSGELVVDTNVTINNNSGESITVSGGGLSRVFNINPTTTAAIIGLTISGGQSATAGGGILNDGTLTILNSTLTGNSTSIDGGAISNSGPGVLTLINTTISGNSATGNGAGVANLGGTVTSINSTITNNVADSDGNGTGTGGGIHHGSGTTTLHNTIVAGNFNEDGTTDAADDISGTVNAASSFNLIGTGGAGGLTNGVNDNQVGVADAGLGALASNGGTTQTHALSPTSAAVETGGNANLPVDTFDLDGDANVAEPLPVDQRGTGFPRNADSQDVNTTQTVDIGAFELHPSIEDIANQTTNEDTVKNVPFNIGDDTGSLIATVVATSSNTTLVPNANLVVSGSGGARNLQITPAANESGTTTITVTVTATNGRTAVDTFDLTVNAANDAPVANDDSYSTDEDTPLTVNAVDGVLANDTDIDTPLSSLTAILVAGPSNALSFTLNADGSFNYTPNANFNGPDTFTYKANDGTADSNVATVTITVNAINDSPTIGVNAGITVAEGSIDNTITNTMLRVDDVDNTATQIVFTIGTAPVNGTLKKLGVALAAGGTFTQDDINNNRITYDHNGTETTSDSFTFTVSDGAGGTIGLTTFNITITGENDAPAITAGGTLNYTENDAATAIDTTITVADGDSANLASATVQINVNYVNGQDVLSFIDTATISGSFNAASGTLTLTGSDTVANYQTALRAVRYNNTSDNPSTSPRTVSWSVNDGILSSNVATSTINVAAVNDAPVNTVPVAQSTNQNTPLTFSSGNGNQISVADVDAGTNAIQVTLTATNGTLTLSGTSGLNFACVGCAGDGTADPTMTFQGTIANINAALNGMTFTPTAGFSGAATLTITSNDLGNTGSGGPLSDTDVINIQVATNVSIQDAQVAEPKQGSVNMIFTVTLSAPAPAGGSSVGFTTVQLAPAINHATAGQDYTTTSGTVNFAAGEQFKTILVPVLSDNKKNEVNETFEVQLSSPVNLTIADGTATGTIIENDVAGAVLISELRTSGPAGDGDDFVEIYNNSDSAHVVNGTGGGYGLFKMGASCSATPVLLGVIPNGTTIPGRGHYLFTGSAYSLANYGGSGAAAGDVTMSSDIESDRNVAIFATTSVGDISSANRLDAVGFGANTGGVCDLFREGATLPPVSGSVLEYSFFRDECGKKGTPSSFGPCPTGGMTRDSNVNNDDFIFVDTTATATAAGQRLGAPGPQNLGSPHLTLDVLALLLDSSKSAAGTPNRVRDTSAIGPNAAEGTMSIRRRMQNNTGAPVTRLRFRIVDMSTAPTTGSTADLRVLSAPTVTVSVNDSATCTAAGFATTPCNVTVVGTTLETPPAQPLGGGLNSSTTVGTITLGTPLAPGASVNVQFLLGVQSTGSFKFFFNVEALP